MHNFWNMQTDDSVQQTEAEVRSTTEPVRNQTTAEQKDAPEWNEFETDVSGETNGLAPRMMGSATIETEQDAPFYAALATAPHNSIIDEQVASSGTAAKREMSGQFGHGSMQYALGIEPIIREGAIFGNDYFAAHERPIQDGAGDYMTPIDGGGWSSAVQQADANANSRAAYQSSMYNAFLGV